VGATLAAISVDPVEANRELAQQRGFEFPILADTDRDALRAFGVVHPGSHPFDGSDMARPATFIIADDRVRWRDVTADYRVRPRPETLLDVLRAMIPPAEHDDR
jgi:peroxiredoxin